MPSSQYDAEGPIYWHELLYRRPLFPVPAQPPPPPDPWAFARLAGRGRPGRGWRGQDDDEFHHPHVPPEEQTIYTPDPAVTYSVSQLAYRRRQLSYYAMQPAETVEEDDTDDDEEDDDDDDEDDKRSRLRVVIDAWTERNGHIVTGLHIFIAGVVAAAREKICAAWTAVVYPVALVMSYVRACIPWLNMLLFVAVPVVALLWALAAPRTREARETVPHYVLVPDVRAWSVCC